MKNSELRRMERLRSVMRLSARGKGVGAALVETFRGSSNREEVEAVRSILLGVPVEKVASIISKEKDYSRDLLFYLVEQAKMDAAEASKRADKLSRLFEHWVRAKQERLIEQRIMETRSLMVSTILGGVTAMVAALGPLLSNFQITLSQQQQQHSAASVGVSQYLGLLFVIPGSFFLGLFFSPKRALLDVAVACLAYAVVVYFFAPLVLSI